MTAVLGLQPYPAVTVYACTCWFNIFVAIHARSITEEVESGTAWLSITVETSSQQMSRGPLFLVSTGLVRIFYEPHNRRPELSMFLLL